MFEFLNKIKILDNSQSCINIFKDMRKEENEQIILNALFNVFFGISH